MVTHVERVSAPPLIRRILRRGSPGATETAPLLARGERRLLRERDTSDNPVVASTQALYHRPVEAPWQRVAWSQVSRFSWEPRSGVLDLTSLGNGAASRLSVRLDPDSRLPALVRERVLATTLVTAEVLLSDGTAALVTARRSPVPPQLTWVVRLPDGVDGDDADVRRQVDDAVRDLRARLGL